MPSRKPVAAVEAAEAEAPQNTAAQETRTVDFFGRTVRVRRPTAEQIMVWQRVAKRAAAMGSAPMTSENAMGLLDRTMRIVETVLADQADRDWLEDQLLEGVLRLDQVVTIVSLTVDAHAAEAADAAPANGPRPARARRR